MRKIVLTACIALIASGSAFAAAPALNGSRLYNALSVPERGSQNGAPKPGYTVLYLIKSVGGLICSVTQKTDPDGYDVGTPVYSCTMDWKKINAQAIYNALVIDEQHPENSHDYIKAAGGLKCVKHEETKDNYSYNCKL